MKDTPAGRELAREADRQAQRSKDERAARATPEARAARERSRRRFASLSANAVRALVRDKYGGNIADEPHRPLRHGELRRIPNANSAVVEEAAGRRLAISTTPIAVKRDDGRYEPIDLSLVETNGGFRPAAGLGPMKFPERIRDGVTLGDEGLVVKPGSGRPDADGAVTGGGVVYANTDTDTDAAVRPTPTGLEFFDVLRSEDSPEALSFSLGGIHDIRLEPSSTRHGAFEIHAGDKELGMFGGVMAVDDDGEPVPVDVHVEGGVLEVHVAHRDGDFAYPIVVDPVLEWFPWQPTGILNTSNFEWHNSGEEASASKWPHYIGNDYLGNGLYVHMKWYGNDYYWPGEAGFYKFTPRGDSFITYAGAAYMEQDLLPEDRDRTCMFVGVESGTPPVWQNHWETCHDEDFNRNWYATLPRTGRNALKFGTYMRTEGWRHQFAENVGHIEMHIADEAPPYFGFPNGEDWTNSKSTRANAYDTGLGVQSIKLNGDEKFNGHCYDYSSQTGDYAFSSSSGACPENAFAEVEVGEGEKLVRWTISDPLNAVDNYRWVRNDASPPELSVSGPLAARDGKTVTAKTSLHVLAQDGRAWDKRSGTGLVQLWDGGAPVADAAKSGKQELSRTSCPETSCSFEDDLDFDPAEYAEGLHTLRVKAWDLVTPANESPPAKLDVIADTKSAAVEVVAHHNLPTKWFSSGTPSVELAAADPGAGVQTLTLDAPGVWTGPTKSYAPCDGTVAMRCPTSPPNETLTYNTADKPLPEGVTSVRASAFDAAGHAAATTASWTLRVDRTKPLKPIVTGSATQPLNPGPRVHVIAEDSENLSAPYGQAGIASVELSVDGSAPVVHPNPGCTPDGCPRVFASDFDLDPAAYSEGVHTLKVVARDAADNATSSDAFDVYVAALNTVARDKLGLEDYFQYHSTETGAGTRLHVNADTGNVLWHSTPIVNPGRGLSSVLNLTYNSHDRGGILGSLIRNGGTPILGLKLSDLVGLAYGEAGNGFSIGISGLTRLNEPLAGVATADLTHEIVLTDPDGTAHNFTDTDNGNGVYQEPAGVNLRLRRFSRAPDKTDKAWAITRPDGVTYYFDTDGYARSIQDRNGNVMRFDYEPYSKVTGAQCDPVTAPLSVLCAKRVVAVVDPRGVEDASQATARSLRIAYYPGGILPIGGSGATIAPELLTVGGQAGRIKTITDHADRVTTFTYDDDGYLTDLTQSGSGTDGTPYDRAFHLGYTDKEPNRVTPDPNRHLNTITDPRGATTKITYDAAPAPGLAVVRSFGRKVNQVEDRRTSKTGYQFGPRGGTAGTTMSVTDGRGKVWKYSQDDAGRPEELIDPLGTKTLLAWGDGDNNVTRLTRAAGTTDAAVTAMEYNQHGQMVKQTDPLGRITTLDYLQSSGTQRSPDGLDANAQFVSDVERITPPRLNWTFFEIQKDAASGDVIGNVLSRQVKDKAAAHTEYDSHGQVTAEVNELGARTIYDEFGFDPNGLPLSRRDARGFVWRYGYDKVGNLTDATDPRGVDTAASTDFKASFLYDAFDRVTSSTTPRDSSAMTPTFTTRLMTYDKNGNLLTRRDARQQLWQRTYTAMDEIQTDEAPATRHYGDSSTATSSEITRLKYDAVGNLTERVSPNGEATPTPDDSATLFAYDAAGRQTVVTRSSSSASELVTSYAYDRRGNVVGIVDPRHNAGADVATAEANTLVTANRRATYAYDKNDNRTTEVEDPGGLALKTGLGYDANQNFSKRIDPRGYAEGELAGHTTTYSYDTNDLVTIVTRGGSRSTRYLRHDNGEIYARQDPRGDDVAGSADHRTGYEYYPTGELMRWTLPRAVGQYGPTATVTYERNAVGDPTKIIDARGKSFVNEFYDGGQLRMTERPGWWKAAFDAGEQPAGDSADLDPVAATANTGFDIVERPYGEEAGGAGDGDLPSSDGEGDYGAVERSGLPAITPRAGRTTFAYDAEMRLSGVTDVSAHTTQMAFDAANRLIKVVYPFNGTRTIPLQYQFDRNGNLRREYDGESYAITHTYDQFDRAVTDTAPGSAAQAPNPAEEATAGASATELTTTVYDDNDNPTETRMPAGKTQLQGYDAVDRMISSTAPGGGVTTRGYDTDGNVTLERRPLGNAVNPPDDRYAIKRTYNSFDELDTETDGFGNATRYGYDRNGNQTSVIAPGAGATPDGTANDIVTTRTYDGRDLLWTETTGASTAPKRTTVTEYDPNANLRRTVKPAGVTEATDAQPQPAPVNADVPSQDGAPTDAATHHATVYAYSADNLRTDEWLPTGTRDADDAILYQRTFARDPRGFVTTIESPFATGKPRATRSGYTYYDNGWIKAQTDYHYPAVGTPVLDHTFSYTYDRRGLQTAWTTAQTGRDVRRTYYPSGQLRMRSASAPGDVERRYTYGQSANRTMAQMIEWKPQDDDDPATPLTWSEFRRTDITRDRDERPTVVDETWSGGSDTVAGYDLDGNVTGQWADGEYRGRNGDGSPIFADGKRTGHTYDRLDREVSTTVRQSGQNSDRVTTSNDYWPSGALRQRTKSNGTVEAFGYFDDGQIALRRRDPAGAPAAEDQAYAYDRNGNRSADERGTHTYNSRDQLVRWQRPAAAGLGALDVTYEYNGSGAMTHKTESENGLPSTTTDYVMEGDRLIEEKVGPATLKQYSYRDDAGKLTGNVTKIDELFAGSTRYEYDGFGRMKLAQGLDTAGVRIRYGYDGLDRRDYFCRNPITADGDCADGTRQDYRYAGLSEQLVRERETDSNDMLTYDYTSDGEGLGQDRFAPTTPQSNTFSAYDVDANGSVVALENADGQITAAAGGAGTGKYELDPFGQTRNEALLSDPAKKNPFRFEGFYYDAGIKAYDMQARSYRPDIGRFMTADRFESAARDFDLQSDPLTQNRYAFAGGNPVTRVEFDGHRTCSPPERVTDRNTSAHPTRHQPAAQRRASGLTFLGPRRAMALREMRVGSTFGLRESQCDPRVVCGFAGCRIVCTARSRSKSKKKRKRLKQCLVRCNIQCPRGTRLRPDQPLRLEAQASGAGPAECKENGSRRIDEMIRERRYPVGCYKRHCHIVWPKEWAS